MQPVMALVSPIKTSKEKVWDDSHALQVQSPSFIVPFPPKLVSYKTAWNRAYIYPLVLPHELKKEEEEEEKNEIHGRTSDTVEAFTLKTSKINYISRARGPTARTIWKWNKRVDNGFWVRWGHRVAPMLPTTATKFIFEVAGEWNRHVGRP